MVSARPTLVEVTGSVNITIANSKGMDSRCTHPDLVLLLSGCLQMEVFAVKLTPLYSYRNFLQTQQTEMG
jgi:hypothetical protein